MALPERFALAPDLTICRILNGMWQVSGAHGRIEREKALGSMAAHVEAGFTTWDLADHYGALKRQLPPPLSFSQTSPSNAAARGEQVTRMMAAIARLPEDHRQVIVLRKIEERPADEVAMILGRSENAVGILLCRALKQLSEALRAENLVGSEGSAPRPPS